VIRRPLLVSVLLIVITMIAGLVIRFAPLGLPASIVKYGGSALWAMMIYWMSSSVLPSWRAEYIGLLSGVVATSVEFFKLYHAPVLEAFRHTIAGVLILGHVFSFKDIAVYWIAIAIAAGLDRSLRHWMNRS
jgi:hypothetical protein